MPAPAPPSASDAPRLATRAGLALAFAGLLALLLALPHGEMAESGEVVVDPETGRHGFVHDRSRMILRGLGAMLGQLSGLALLASLALAYDLPLVRRLRRARRTHLHRRLGVAVLVLAGGHTLLLLANGDLRGWAPGALSLVAFALHGATGALKPRLLRAWGAAWWRHAHRSSAWAALLLTVEHVVMASWHFGLARHFETTGWGH